MCRVQLFASHAAFLPTVDFGVAWSAAVSTESQIVRFDRRAAVAWNPKMRQNGCFPTTVTTRQAHQARLTSG